MSEPWRGIVSFLIGLGLAAAFALVLRWGIYWVLVARRAWRWNHGMAFEAYRIGIRLALTPVVGPMLIADWRRKRKDRYWALMADGVVTAYERTLKGQGVDE